MTDVLFGQAYYLRFDPKLWADQRPYPPLGSLQAASYARGKGYEVAFFDAMLARTEAEWGHALDLHRPRWAVLFEDNFNYLSKMCLSRMREAAFTMIAMARTRGVPVIVCGSDATDHAQAYLAQGADAVLLGEGELSLGELLDSWSGRSSVVPQNIQAISFRSAELVHLGQRRPVIKNLDALPPPAWDLVDFGRYQAIWRPRHGRYSVNMVTTRGCPYHCNWCAKPIWGQRYNVRSVDHLVQEMLLLKRLSGMDHIWFADDIFGLKPGWTATFSEAVNQAGVKTPFKCLSRADLLVRPGEVEALRAAGCELVWMGAESGSQKILDAMEKGTTVDEIRSATKKLRDAGIRVGWFLQFGYPGENIDDVESTLALLRQCRPDEVGISVSYPLPGTKFYERVKAKLGSKTNWVDSDDLDLLYQGPYPQQFYRQLYQLVHQELQLQQALVELDQAWRQKSLGLKQWRRAAGWLWRRATLPRSRQRLHHLAENRSGTEGLAPALTYHQAATPSPQD